ncbi:aminotransferase class I/II-fold pyridoxal phosphate-dependent enzyme [Nocardioides sp. J2M5]|uniref:serine hydroxymethyltransferase n=1 Tax=Nocardioides palaemonis TaxID=2829810 RepID=UPI001BAA58C6|nr:aminotransferase class I/II-fold pyridoxal phosphate-dependent enzyme [Nocardioides palaemonis]MBS2938634.1 aminotransferase class I/II-fold pyridoxal phosphate-dependent enzyme [Nocardioides palaemonis]
MTALAPLSWVPEPVRDHVHRLATDASSRTPLDQLAELDRLVALNRQIHDRDCLNLNPATNVMNPRAEAMLASGLGSRASLGHPGEKYETGLEAIEQIEVVAAELAAEVFGARYAEVRVPSGAIANLYAFLATCEPGDTIIAPPASIGGHVTHHAGGSAGMYRLRSVPAPVDPGRFTVDVAALRDLAQEVRPRMITIGTSMNLYPHPVAALREVADEVGAVLLFDAAHVCGLIAGGAWPNPLDEGAHLMTMSTYKSLGGPAGGLVVTNDAGIAERLDAIAYPGLTANSDAGRAAALAVTLVDWSVAGRAYADTMVEAAAALAEGLLARGVPVHRGDDGPTRSHQLAIDAEQWRGGHEAARLLRPARLLASGIGLPTDSATPMPGLRLGTPEAVRLGMTASDMDVLAALVADGLAAGGRDREATLVGERVTELRSGFSGVHFTAEPRVAP